MTIPFLHPCTNAFPWGWLRSALLISTMMCALPAAEPVRPILMGDAAFLPTAEHPVGLRGDGSGAWPGATPTAQWNAADGTNIVWKARLPGPSFSQPIVVGSKVFTLADPNILLCLDARDGRILWQREVDHTLAMPPEQAKQARSEIAFWEGLFRQYAIWLDLKQGYATDVPRAEIDGALQAAEEHGFAVNGPGQANFSMMTLGKGGHDALWDRLWNDQNDFSLYYFGHWEGILTQTFATPVSDGDSIFVTMSNDQTACYDLDGKCRWLVWDRPKQAVPARSEHVRYALSPRLVDDRLIVTACGEMRAYDKRTGRKLWGVFSKKDFGSHWSKVSTPVPLRLQFDGKPLDVLLSPGSGIYRLGDGALLGTLPELSGYEGSTALCDGAVYVRRDAPDGGGSKRLAGRFEASGPDHVAFTELWRVPSGGRSHNASDILYNGWIYSPACAQRTEVLTGKADPMFPVRGGFISPSLGGRLLVCPMEGTYQRQGVRKVRNGVISAVIISLDDPTKGVIIDNAFVDQRYDDEQSFRLRWRWRGNGDAVSNSAPVFHGNRMYFRTVGYLWCIGDPALP